MSSMSLTFSGSIIGISYGEMNSVKSNLRRANDMLQQSQSKINSAKAKVQVDRSSSRLRLSEEQISTIYTNAAKQKTKIDKLCNNIDITIRKFKEVDARCAARIRSISKSYDKSKSLWERIKSAVSSFSTFAMNGFKSLMDMGYEAISALGQKISEGFSAVSEWMDKHPVVVNVVTGALDVLAIATTAVAIVAGTVTGVGLVFAAVGAVYAASTLIDSGVKIYNNIKNGTNSGFNFIEEGFKKVMGDTAGEMAFGVTNLIALAVNLPSMAKGALKLGTGAINFFKEGEGIAKIGASISSIGKNISSFLEEGKAAFKALGEVGTNKLSNFLESVKDVKNNIGKTLEEIKVNIENIGPKLAYELKGDGTNHYKFDVIDNRITNTSDNYKVSGVDEIEDVAKGVNKTELEIKSLYPRGDKLQYDIFIKQDEIALNTYTKLRETGLDENELKIFSENTGLSIDTATKLKEHVILTEHQNLLNNETRTYFSDYFQPDLNIAYGWEKALKGELNIAEKEWFKQLAEHELAESELMKQGIPYRTIESINSDGFLTGNPPGAHDLAPLPPGDFPGFEPKF